jgi:hypothetical protein
MFVDSLPTKVASSGVAGLGVISVTGVGVGSSATGNAPQADNKNERMQIARKAERVLIAVIILPALWNVHILGDRQIPGGL